jgi:nucleoside-diphosphate-sugar epimerase
MPKHVLIAGASGLVGSAALHHFTAMRACRVTAISRRAPLEAKGARFIALDLNDADACLGFAAENADVTHLVYAALHEEPGLIAGWRADSQIAANDRMLRNLFTPLEKFARGLRHVTLLQGTKAYGAHIAPIDVPAREDRSELRGHANFYWQQENFIRDAQKAKRWSFSIMRPQIVFGGAIGSAMNLIASLGAWAALRKEQGFTLPYPGGPATILEAVDADLLARAIAWAGEAETARNEIFNVTNGDVFVWKNVWPAIADALGMEAGPAEAQSIATALGNDAASAAWDGIRARHGLVAPQLKEFLGQSHYYADFCLGVGQQGGPGAAIVSTVKLRRAGFHEFVDTEEMFRRWFADFQARRLLPPK